MGIIACRLGRHFQLGHVYKYEKLHLMLIPSLPNS
jgi:hypothetical protein